MQNIAKHILPQVITKKYINNIVLYISFVFSQSFESQSQVASVQELGKSQIYPSHDIYTLAMLFPNVRSIVCAFLTVTRCQGSDTLKLQGLDTLQILNG